MLVYDCREVIGLLIGELCAETNLTKKAVEYYIEQGLISPAIRENGYRDFDRDSLEQLKKIAVLRKLGLGTEEIKAALAGEMQSVLRKFTVEKAMNLQREEARLSLLDQLNSGKGWEQISPALRAIEQNKTVTEKLLDAFPGYYGRFICLHFAHFLNDPVTTEEQETAYGEVLRFLDDVKPLAFPKEVQDFLQENAKGFDTQCIVDMNERVRQAVEKPEQFFSDNRETLDWYLTYKQSAEYQNTPVQRIQSLMKDFHATSGYYDVFIPAMKRLSVSYAVYYGQLEAANDMLLKQFPEFGTLNRES